MSAWQRKMRWVLTVLLAFTLLFAVTNCGDQETPTTPKKTKDKTDDEATYTLTYDGNGASGTPSAVTGLTNGQSVTLDDGSGMTLSGYSFSGWTDSGGTEYAGGS